MKTILLLCLGLWPSAWSEVDRQTQANISEVGLEIDGLNRNKQDSIDFATRAPNAADRGTTWVQYRAANDDTVTQHMRHPVSGAWVNGAAGAISGWVNFTSTGTLSITAGSNVSSVTDNGIGDFTINWDTDFSSVFYAIAGSAGEDNATPSDARILSVSTLAAGTTRIAVRLVDNTLRDVTRVMVLAVGIQ